MAPEQEGPSPEEMGVEENSLKELEMRKDWLEFAKVAVAMKEEGKEVEITQAIASSLEEEANRLVEEVRWDQFAQFAADLKKIGQEVKIDEHMEQGLEKALAKLTGPNDDQAARELTENMRALGIEVEEKK